MAPDKRMRNWCFTKYDLTVPDWNTLPDVRYVCYQLEECPDSGRRHLQGYLELTKSMRLGAVKRDIFGDNTVHLEPRRGSRDQARDYCMKEESRVDGEIPFEHGEWERTPGKRSDLDEIWHMIKEGKSKDEIIEAFPAQYMRMSKSIRELITHEREKRKREEMSAALDEIELREWQEDVVSAIRNQNDREVLWVCDRVGGKGKSVLGRYLECKMGAYYVTGGKAEDIAYDYMYQEIVVFDLSRDVQYMPYHLMESLKNGKVFSPKYESTTKTCPGTKVVVFSNSLPDVSKLSQDRWNILDLDNAPEMLRVRLREEMTQVSLTQIV